MAEQGGFTAEQVKEMISGVNRGERAAMINAFAEAVIGQQNDHVLGLVYSEINNIWDDSHLSSKEAELGCLFGYHEPVGSTLCAFFVKWFQASQWHPSQVAQRPKPVTLNTLAAQLAQVAEVAGDISIDLTGFRAEMDRRR